MPEQHTVQSGDCISSIANEHGFFPDTVWNDSANAALREKRKNPNVLAPGDTVVIPDKREKTEARDSGQEYRFRKRGVPAKFRLRLLAEGKPIANAPFTLLVNGQT